MKHYLIQFFVDTLMIKNNLTKENLNMLNLDAAMIRESLFDGIINIIRNYNSGMDSDMEGLAIGFFYEKVVRDRNHGILSSLSLLKLFEERSEEKRKISEEGILQAAAGIAGHDEDIWEALCGCQGYRRSSKNLPSEEKCVKNCSRALWPSKRNKIYRSKMIEKDNKSNLENYKCECWEKELMDKKLFAKINFNEHPILFLLIFCDNIQDEGRVTSSDEQISGDLSTLTDIEIDKNSKVNFINVKLKSHNQEKKEDEIERVAWCLEDVRFKISIGDKPIKMDGRGGG